MISQWLTVAVAPSIDLPGGQQAVLMLLRWIHLVAGVLWIGLLYFFNLIHVPFLQQLDAAQKPAVMRGLVPRAMWWFRMSSVVTVLVGFGYWNIIVATDAHNAIAAGVNASPGRVMGSFVVIWTLAFFVEMGMLMSPAEVLRKGPVFGTVMAVVILAAAYCFLAVNEQGWESNRALAIGIGGGIGWFMMFNVWGVVWRMQKKLIRWSSEGKGMPPEADKAARLSFLASRLSFWLSFPLLFFMGAASHYILFAGR